MANDLLWSKRSLEEFRAAAILTDDEVAVLIDWAHGKTVVNTSMMRNMSPRTVNRIRHRLRQKYDMVQPYTTLPPRKTGR